MSRIGAKLWWLSSLLLAFAGGWLIWQSFIVPPPRSLQPDYVAAAGDVQITIDDIVVSGLTRPVQVTHAGDGSGRLFIVEQPGRIRIIKNGTLLPTPFLDIAGSISYGGERGLLGLAFHPTYRTKGFFSVNYTRAGDGATVIARYTASAADPDRAATDSAVTLLTVPQPYTNHNGGQLLFSPVDGYLYIGMGDGGSGGDPQNNGQNRNTLLGAMLRIDVNGRLPYTIPPTNPYVGKDGLDEIWAIGLRNPWRFSFDRATGDLYIGDVGQNEWEEISYQAAGTPGGVNFGWRCKEGTHPYNFSGSCGSATLTDPIAEYNHSAGRSVTGGFVYRGALYPALAGRYFYADYVNGKIWSLYKTSSNPTTWSAPELELQAGFNISAFGEDEAGELYVVDWSGGTLRRLADVNGPAPNLTTSRKRVSSPSVDPGAVVTYTLTLINTGGAVNQTLALTDTVPTGLTYIPGSLTTTQGAVSAAAAPRLTWQGTLAANSRVTLTYKVTVTGAITGSLVNHAYVTGGGISPLDLPASLFIPRTALTSTLQDLFFPGSQPGQLQAEVASSIDCDTCHTEPIYDRWRGSLMGQAGRDVLMWAALSIANVDAPASGEYCLRCHMPKGWLEGHSSPPDGSAMTAQDLSNGVACAFCHRMVDPRPSTSDEARTIDLAVRAALTSPVPSAYTGSSAFIVDPADNRRGPFSFSPAIPYHTAYRTDFLGQTTNAVTRSRLCGTCHNLDNPLYTWDEARQQYWPNAMDSAAPEFANGALFPIERTFDEWLYSEYAQGGVYAPQFAGSKADGIVESCQDCHLRRTTGNAVDPAFNPITRDCQTAGCLPEHTLAGGNTWMPGLLQDSRWRLWASGEATYLAETTLRARQMLTSAAAMTVTLTTSGTQKLAIVRVTNQTGHKLPTGYPEGRQMWIALKAFNAAGELIYQSGSYQSATGTLVKDPAIKVYEIKQGLTSELAALLDQPAGESFHFVLNNTVIKDNRIPPRGYTQAAFDKPGLRPVGATYADGQYWDDTLYTLPAEAETVLVRLYYQTASKEYINFLRTRGGVDGETLGTLWEASKSPPQVMAIAMFPVHGVYLPVVLKDS